MNNEILLDQHALNQLMLSEQQLDDQLPWVRQAAKNHAAIERLCLRPAYSERQFTAQLELCPERGVVGDRWSKYTWIYLPDGSPHPNLQLCLMPLRVWQLVCKPAQDKGVLHPGDNLIADLDCSEQNLPVGQQLQLGSAVIEVSDVFNNACSKWRARYGSASVQWINRPPNIPLRLRGVLCRIVKAGTVSLNDRVEKL